MLRRGKRWTHDTYIHDPDQKDNYQASIQLMWVRVKQELNNQINIKIIQMKSRKVHRRASLLDEASKKTTSHKKFQQLHRNLVILQFQRLLIIFIVLYIIIRISNLKESCRVLNYFSDKSRMSILNHVQLWIRYTLDSNIIKMPVHTLVSVITHDCKEALYNRNWTIL